MPNSSVTLDQLPQAMAADLAADKTKARLAMRTAAELMRTEAIVQIHATRPFPPIDTSQMERGYIVEPSLNGFVLENTAPHAAHMEYGTRPGTWVPLGALYRWAERKLRGLHRRGPGRTRAAFAMARGAQLAIHARGLRARGFHERAAKKSGEFIRRAVLLHFGGK